MPRTHGLALVVLLGLTRLASAAEQKAPAATSPSSSSPSSAAQRQARGDAAARAFIMGKYDEALAIYSELYIASDGRPEYLRNIGRCQQKLKQHDAAIDSFRDYLRRMKRMSNEERREVQGFISESETARLNQSNSGAPSAAAPPPAVVSPPPAAAAPPPPAAAPPPPAVEPTPPAAAPAPPPAAPVTPLQPQPSAASPPGYYAPPAGYPAQSQPPAGYPAPSSPPYSYPPNGYDTSHAPAGGLTTTVPPATPAPRRHTSAVKVLGVVGIIAGAVVLAGGVGAWALSQSTYDTAKKDGCPNGSTDCQSKADLVKTLNTTSKVLAISGGVVAALGVTLVIVAPSSTSKETQVGFMLQQRF